MDVVEVTARLMARFGGRLSLDLISRVVTGCRRDLDGTPAGAMPELVERLARQRLTDASEPPARPGPGPPDVPQLS